MDQVTRLLTEKGFMCNDTRLKLHVEVFYQFTDHHLGNLIKNNWYFEAPWSDKFNMNRPIHHAIRDLQIKYAEVHRNGFRPLFDLVDQLLKTNPASKLHDNPCWIIENRKSVIFERPEVDDWHTGAKLWVAYVLGNVNALITRDQMKWDKMKSSETYP